METVGQRADRKELAVRTRTSNRRTIVAALAATAALAVGATACSSDDDPDDPADLETPVETGLVDTTGG